MLTLRAVVGDAKVGTVALVGTDLVFTGAAAAVFRRLEEQFGPQVLWDNLTAGGWSNGYLYLAQPSRRSLALRHGDHDQSDHGNRDGDDDDGEDEGKYGYGVDANGVSYSENDLDEDGNPRFSQDYRDQYGPVLNEYSVGDPETGAYAVAVTESGSLHFADDRGGTHERVVVQEFTAAGASSLSRSMEAVNDGGPGGLDKTSGVRVTPNDRPSPYNQDFIGADVSFAGGTTISLDGNEVVEMAEGLRFAAGDLRDL